MIINGDSLHELKKLPENSVDSVVTDPPYGLSFMGKKWDYDVPSTELWQEVFRVLKPGGHLLAFAGTRTQHRMAVNIEDAGFEIRDMIAWVYGSGFPKSLNIGKALDKMAGEKREVIGQREDFKKRARKNGVESKDYIMAGGWKSTEETVGVITKPATPEAEQWEGWGTALKPALEPITVARKPIKGSVAQNVLEWGTGGINIDGCRVGTEQTTTVRNGNSGGERYGRDERKGSWANPPGRFPANLLHDGSDEVVGLFPETKGDSRTSKSTYDKGHWGNAKPVESDALYSDSGSAARYFYCAKASKSERNKGLEGFEVRTVNDGRDTPIDNAFQRGETPRANIHPTVKPVKLMQYLVRLVTPKGGTVLDPFNGSGTTGIACKLEGFDYIGIELDPEYCKISEARIEAWEEDISEKVSKPKPSARKHEDIQNVTESLTLF